MKLISKDYPFLHFKKRKIENKTMIFTKCVLLSLFFFVLYTENAFANYVQQDPIVVKGNVTDGQGMPLPGATVVEKGTSNGVQTDFDGNYSIQVQSGNAILTLSYVGMKEVEKELNNNTTIDVVLLEDLQSLDEVVVIGY